MLQGHSAADTYIYIYIYTYIHTHIHTYIHTYTAEGGIRTFYKGILPRTLWISLGGCVFFGSYESVKELLYYAL